jgi:eukaryotic-like serine/threonine-protein kinase
MSDPERPLVSRLFPRAAATQSSLSGSSLPADLETAAAHRLGALALVVSIVATVLGTVAQLAGQGAALGPRVRLALIAADVLLSFGLYAAIARGWITARRALQLGLGYQVAHALLISVVFHALTLTPGAVVRGWTSVAVWTVLYPLIVPSRPGRVWFASLATALMDPVGLWVNLAAGAPVPSAPEIAQRLFPTVFACILAPIAARIVYGLTVEVHKAREMGSYRLVEKLGEGGMGEVWRAEHRMLARGAAIKLIRPALGGVAGAPETEMVKRFEREARATAALRSPHTIEVYDYGVAADGTFHYVMELLEGFSLQTLVERFGPVPAERAVGLLRQVCHSLAEAHASGLVHRDVKPANMFVCQLGLDVDFVKVLDFGLVKRRGPQARGEEVLTVAGAFTGTPAFMPPEIALGAERIDGRADIYALGCVAYWLLTGQRVFESGSAMQMVVDHIRTPAVPPSRRGGPPIPPALEEIVLRCLEKDPGARPPSAASLSLELKALDLEGQWTEERAQAWWRAHPPAGREKPAAPTLDVDDSREETRSRLDRWPPVAAQRSP